MLSLDLWHGTEHHYFLNVEYRKTQIRYFSDVQRDIEFLLFHHRRCYIMQQDFYKTFRAIYKTPSSCNASHKQAHQLSLWLLLFWVLTRMYTKLRKSAMHHKSAFTDLLNALVQLVTWDALDFLKRVLYTQNWATAVPLKSVWLAVLLQARVNFLCLNRLFYQSESSVLRALLWCSLP
jgi:hypothetical protein